ncbi:hypothetical protein Fmac_001449 [Flemingia macrophylla]|uniref:Transposase n=1 Tax=Flemingia macrophylla TaxID=520843 RepID=A0ABD1NH58_9FABA
MLQEYLKSELFHFGEVEYRKHIESDTSILNVNWSTHLILVNWNTEDQPIDNVGALLNRFLGRVARYMNIFPISYQSWRKIPKDYKEDVLKNTIQEQELGRKVSRGEVWIATHKHANGDFVNNEAREISIRKNSSIRIKYIIPFTRHINSGFPSSCTKKSRTLWACPRFLIKEVYQQMKQILNVKRGVLLTVHLSDAHTSAVFFDKPIQAYYKSNG